MSDILTMLWKESKDVLFQGGWRSLIRPLIVVGMMGIYLPLQLGSQWIDLTFLAMLLLLWIPFFVIISFIGDVIAGERERHTLETLLASRMPDRAILLGKVVAVVFYAWGMGVISLLLGLVLVNLFRTQGNWMFYPLDLFVDALVLILLVSVLGASAGTLISMRVATVRQAQQILSIGTIVFVFGIVFVLKAIPANVFSSLNYSQFLLITMAFIALLDAILLGLSLASFQRSHLILS
ncbi:MAG: ABC transporter permease [Ktedonobacteraceae bacterium]